MQFTQKIHFLSLWKSEKEYNVNCENLSVVTSETVRHVWCPLLDSEPHEQHIRAGDGGAGAGGGSWRPTPRPGACHTRGGVSGRREKPKA